MSNDEAWGRLAFVSDLHFSLRLPHAEISPDGTSSDRLDDVSVVLDEIENYCLEHDDVRGVFILGDLFDKNSPDMATLTRVGEKLRTLSSHVQVNILPGNHDAYDRGQRLYTLSLFESLKIHNVRPILKPGVSHRFEDVTLFSLPWMPDEAASREIENFAFEEGQVNICLLHQTVDGCVEGKRPLSSPIKSSQFDRFDFALSGHIHESQKMGNLLYLGAPLDLRFGEKPEPRGFWSLELSELELDFVPVTATPVFRSLLLTEDVDIEKELSELAEKVRGRDHYVDFRVKGSRDHVQFATTSIRDWKEDLRKEVGIKRLRKVRVRKEIEGEGTSRAVRKDTETTLPGVLLEEFVDGSAAIPEGVEVGKLKRFGLLALENAE